MLPLKMLSDPQSSFTSNKFTDLKRVSSTARIVNLMRGG